MGPPSTSHVYINEPVSTWHMSDDLLTESRLTLVTTVLARYAHEQLLRLDELRPGCDGRCAFSEDVHELLTEEEQERLSS